MSYLIVFSEELKEKLATLKKKDKTTYQQTHKKILQIAELTSEGIDHFKNLKSPLQHLKRVHIGSFVLTFHVKRDTIIFEDLKHHDDAYE